MLAPVHSGWHPLESTHRAHHARSCCAARSTGSGAAGRLAGARLGGNPGRLRALAPASTRTPGQRSAGGGGRVVAGRWGLPRVWCRSTLVRTGRRWRVASQFAGGGRCASGFDGDTSGGLGCQVCGADAVEAEPADRLMRVAVSDEVPVSLGAGQEHRTGPKARPAPAPRWRRRRYPGGHLRPRRWSSQERAGTPATSSSYRHRTGAPASLQDLLTTVGDLRSPRRRLHLAAREPRHGHPRRPAALPNLRRPSPSSSAS